MKALKEFARKNGTSRKTWFCNVHLSNRMGFEHWYRYSGQKLLGRLLWGLPCLLFWGSLPCSFGVYNLRDKDEMETES